MSRAIFVLANHGDAEWVKLIGLAIFAAISIIGSLIKKVAESRKPTEIKDKPTPPPLNKAAPRKTPKPLGKARKPLTPVPRLKDVPIAVKVAIAAAAKGPVPSPTTDVAPAMAAPSRHGWTLGPRDLRYAVVLSEILGPPRAIREFEVG